jgi:RHS repeat-associated protein
VSSTVAGTTLAAYSGIDAIGDRLTTGVSGAYGYLVPDLHGNVVAIATSAGAWTTAYRYDAYGETVDVCSGSITSLWRFQGRILESAPGSTGLYDFSARSYDPSLGAFTSFDSVSGSAQNPLTLNRYLYANANPATLVDPDGHCAREDNWSGCESGGAADFQKAISKKNNTCTGHDFDPSSCKAAKKPDIPNAAPWDPSGHGGGGDWTPQLPKCTDERTTNCTPVDGSAPGQAGVGGTVECGPLNLFCLAGDTAAFLGDVVSGVAATAAQVASMVLWAGGQVVTHVVAAIEDLFDVHTVGACVQIGGFIQLKGFAGFGGSISVCGMITAKGQTGTSITVAGGPGMGLTGLSGSTGFVISSGQDIEDQKDFFDSGSSTIGPVEFDSNWGKGHCTTNENAVSTQYVGRVTPPTGAAVWQGKSWTWVFPDTPAAAC